VFSVVPTNRIKSDEEKYRPGDSAVNVGPIASATTSTQTT
jgi:hypothetical protein